MRLPRRRRSKYDGIFTLQITGDGPIRLLVTDLTTDGALRGYALFDLVEARRRAGQQATTEAPDGYVPKLFGQGRLTFTVDQGQHTERYQGVVPLEGATLADCAHTYFRQSEQLPTGIKIVARRSRDGRNGQHWHGAALMVQQMPEFDAGRVDIDLEQREDDWRQGGDPDGLGDRGRDARSRRCLAPTLLYRLFHLERPRQFEPRADCRALPLQP